MIRGSQVTFDGAVSMAEARLQFEAFVETKKQHYWEIFPTFGEAGKRRSWLRRGPGVALRAGVMLEAGGLSQVI